MLQYFQCEQNLLTNSILTYTFTTLLVNQWELLTKKFTSDVDSGQKEMQLIFKIICRCAFIFLQILLAGRLISDFGDSTAILNLVDIFRRWCKLNFGPMRDQAKQPCFSERISVGRQYFHFLCKYLGIICQKRLGKPFQKLIWIYYYILSRI